MITSNGFQGGLNQDLSKTKLPNTNYLDAQNIRLITNEGQSSGSLTNIRGNKLAFTIPNTFNVYKIAVNLAGPYIAGGFIINSQASSGTFTPSINTTGQDIYDFINNDIGLTNFGTTYNVAIATNYVIIYSTSVDTITSFAGTGLTVTTSVPAEANLIPIGFVLLRDFIYLYTTPNTSKNPGGHDADLTPDTSSTGQVFRLDYDPITYATSLELIYNNYLDFTAYRQIATTATLGRYENQDTQRIYWTDFFNPLRSMNTSDPDLMAITPNELNIKPPVNFSIPILKKITTGGQIPVSVCQLAYRLKNTGGAITNYSELSNMVNIVPADESSNTGGSNFKDYIGAPQGYVTSKAITWTLFDLDTNFDRIELVIVRRESISGTVDIIQFADEPIPSNGNMEVIYTGAIALSIISLNEFNTIAGAFTHCKTIGSKDNILFVGNVKNRFSDITYDARAFRAKTSGGTDIYLTNTGVQALYNPTTAAATLDTSDAINDYTNANAGYYQPGTAKLGGSGTNIKYEFGTVAIPSDVTISLGTPMSGSDYRHTNPNYLINATDLGVKRIDGTLHQVYPTNAINDDIKYAYYSGVYKGYERSEIYRLGITFFDKQKNPIFAKWIGDIKMPNYDDVNDNPLYEDGTASPNADFRASFVVGTTAYVNQLFIKFTVVITDSLSSIIDGYTICRVERTEENKSILGSGLITQTYSDGGHLWLPDTQLNSDGFGGFTSLNINGAGTGVSGLSLDTKITFDCPQFLLTGYTGYKAGDKLQIVERYDSNYSTFILDAGIEPYVIGKYYISDARYSGTGNQVIIGEGGECDSAGEFQFISGSWPFSNYTRSTANTSDSLGSKTLCLGLNAAINFDGTYVCTEANGKKLMAQYIRTLSSQYGGNTYSARSNNEYISCSHYRPIKAYTTTSGTSDVFQVFGGDVYTQVYDNQKEIKNWGQTARGQYGGGPYTKTSLTFYFPCTASHNTDLRHGIHVNHNLDDDNGSNASGYEQQDYNPVYSSENNIRKFFPKPTEFSLEEEFDNRVYYSSVKINGETTDSWGIFQSNNYWDVEGSYGPINVLIALDSEVLFWQDFAFGSLMINPVSIVTDNNGLVTVLGKGNVIQKHVYSSNSVGTQHQNSIIESNTQIYWIDVANKKAYRTTDSGFECISVGSGMQSFFNNFIQGEIKNSDKPVYHTGTYRAGITGYFDSNNNEIVYTLFDWFGPKFSETQQSKTLIFNETIGKYISFYSYKPYQYIYNGLVMYSMDSSRYQSLVPPAGNTQKAYLHELDQANWGQFYGTYTDSYLKLLVNPTPQIKKVFDNFHIQTEEQALDIYGTATDTASGITPSQVTFDRLRTTTDYQTSGVINLVVNTNIKRSTRYWKTDVPKDTIGSPYTSFKPRTKDFYMNVELWYLSTGKRFIIHDILTEYKQTGIPITTISSGESK